MSERSWMHRISVKEVLALVAFSLLMGLVLATLLGERREAGASTTATTNPSVPEPAVQQTWYQRQAGMASAEPNLDAARVIAAPPPPPSCSTGVTLPDDLEVESLGVYGAASAAQQQAGGANSDGHARGRVSVRVGKTAKPLLLVLSAYEPVEWALQLQPGARLLGVVGSGYYEQTVTGIPPESVLINSSYKSQQAGCAHFYAYQAAQLPKATQRVQAWTQHPIDRMQGHYEALGFDVGDRLATVIPAPEAAASAMATSTSSPVPPPGEDGLTWLEDQGALRMATEGEINAWYAKAGRSRGEDNRLMHRHPYLVLDQMTLPDGLFGAHAQVFIIPKDVPFPRGPRGHNLFLRMREGTCVMASNLDC